MSFYTKNTQQIMGKLAIFPRYTSIPALIAISRYDQQHFNFIIKEPSCSYFIHKSKFRRKTCIFIWTKEQSLNHAILRHYQIMTALSNHDYFIKSWLHLRCTTELGTIVSIVLAIDNLLMSIITIAQPATFCITLGDITLEIRWDIWQLQRCVCVQSVIALRRLHSSFYLLFMMWSWNKTSWMYSVYVIIFHFYL